jgi:hypothetical protein
VSGSIGTLVHAEARPEMVELAQLRRHDPDRRPVLLRKVAAALAERGYVASTGKPYEAAAVASMLVRGPTPCGGGMCRCGRLWWHPPLMVDAFHRKHKT